MLTLSIVAALIGATRALCPSSFELVRNGECYKEYNTGIYVYASNGLNTAKSYCGDDSQLVSIHSQQDQDYWYSVAKTNKNTGSNYGNVFLGLQCNQKTYNWEWADGSKVNFLPQKFDSMLTSSCSNNYIYSWYVDGTSGEWKAVTNSYIFFDLYCVVVPSQSIPSADSACNDFVHDKDNNVCYQVGSKAINASKATTTCSNFNSRLASVHSPEENSFIRRLAVSQGLRNGVHIGGSVKTVRKNTTIDWIDKSDFDYDNFAPGFPIDGMGSCVAMDTNSLSAPWLNVDCSTELPFVCLRKPQESAFTCDGGLRNEGDVIHSPGYPTNSSIPCDFMLKVNPGYLVEVEILNLEANSCCDRLVLTEGTIGGSVIASLTGDRVNGKKYRTTSQNFMRASWQPNGGVNVRGAMFTFRAVKK